MRAPLLVLGTIPASESGAASLMYSRVKARPHSTEVNFPTRSVQVTEPTPDSPDQPLDIRKAPPQRRAVDSMRPIQRSSPRDGGQAPRPAEFHRAFAVHGQPHGLPQVASQTESAFPRSTAQQRSDFERYRIGSCASLLPSLQDREPGFAPESPARIPTLPKIIATSRTSNPLHSGIRSTYSEPDS